MIHDMVGGGVPLNFKVVDNTTKTANPPQNTIWVNTDTPITRWYFSAAQPEGMEDGAVWFLTGVSSFAEFNALKKNGILVYPLKANQYISGALVDKTAKSYQNGEWVDWWDGTIYNYGNLYEHITGGWKNWGSTVTPTITYTKDYIEMEASGTSGKMCAHRVANTFDLTGVTSIKAEIQSNKYNRCSIYARHATTGVMSYVRSTANDKKTVTLDTSKLSGEHMIMMRIDWSESETFWMRIYSLKLNFG